MKPRDTIPGTLSMQALERLTKLAEPKPHTQDSAPHRLCQHPRDCRADSNGYCAQCHQAIYP